MKSYFILIIALWTFGALNLRAQSTIDVQQTENSIRPNGKYALLVMKAPHLKAGISTGLSLKKMHPYLDFQILVCGELVKEISQNPALHTLISQAVQQHRLTLLVCGLSIEQFNVEPSLLPKEMVLTENGLVYMFGLQEQGFKTIIL